MATNKLIRITTVPLSLSKLLKGQMRFMSQYYDVIGVSSDGNVLQEVSEYERIQVKAIEMTRKITLLKDLRSLIHMIWFLRKEKPLIVHTHTPKAGIIGMMAAWFVRVPIRLHTVAGLPLMEANGNKRKLLNFVEKLTYAFANHVYPNSRGLEKFILENKFCKKEKLKVIGNGSSNGIDTTHFHPSIISEEEKQALRKELNIAPDDFVFIFIGRMVKDKGVNELISAFGKLEVGSTKHEVEKPHAVSGVETSRAASIKDSSKFTEKVDRRTLSPLAGEPEGGLKTKNCKLLLVGPYEQNLDPILPETKQAIDENPNIIHVGFQADVRSYFAISDCLVFPSYREGFPNVVMQAGAMGLPSIVTDINGCNEIIIDGENGVIIPPKDENALFEKMRFFLENPNDVQKMASVSREMITSRYEQEVVWNAVLEEYRKMLKC